MKKKYGNNKSLAIIALVALLLLYGSFLTQKVNLVTADLGRHIKNGETLLDGQKDVLNKNFYSYTQPSFVVANHHWGTGVIFYLLWNIVGFSSLHFLFIVLSLATFAILFWFTQKRAGPGLATIAALMAMPLILERTEIRPEIFSYFFAVLFFVLLWRLLENKQTTKSLLIILPLIEIFWVNTHIYFILGPLLIGAFLLGALINKQKDKIKGLFGIFFATLITTLITPLGLKGTIAISVAFTNYGYRLVENQSIWFLENLITNPNLTIFKIIFFLLVLSFIVSTIKARRVNSWPLLFIAIGMSTMGWLALRNITIFGLFAIPLLAINGRDIFFKDTNPHQKNFNVASVVIASIIILFVLIGGLSPLLPNRNNFGVGVLANNEASVEFIKDQGITGPIFNNYDIGGYLIFHLYPQERVFVDNRPEAYSVSFFKETYIRAQEDNNEWDKLNKEYNFNAIIFSHRDFTPWGQNFLITRIGDPEWAPVFVDDYIIIFIKRTEENTNIISNYEIPKNNFGVIQN